MRINSLSNVNNFQSVNMNQGMDVPEIQSESAAQTSAAVQVQQKGGFVQKTNSADGDAQWSDEKEMNDEMLARSIQQANKNLAQYNRVVERSVHEVTKTVMYTVRDSVTNEVIAEFPPKRIQDMIAKMWEFAGIFVDEKA